MFPTECPLLQPQTEALEGLGQAVGCQGTQCPWFEKQCLFVERLLRLMTGDGGPLERDPAG